MLLITPDDALASVMVVEAAYQALRQQRWTTVSYDVTAAIESQAAA
jgi:hypothetical protein